MVKRVYGFIDGKEMVLTPFADGQWSCVIPNTEDGEYTVELYAEDEAGNIGFFATVLFEVHAKCIQASFRFINYALANETVLQHINISVPEYNMVLKNVTGGDDYGTD